MKKRVTIKDVAKKAGVTHPTVSRALSGSAGASEETRKRIANIARNMGYKPDLIARSLVRSATRMLACIIPDLNPHVQPILRGVVDACTRNNYGLMLFSTDYWSEEELSYIWVVDNWRVDGVLIYNIMHQKKAEQDIRALQCENIPFVFINKYLRKKKTSAVGVDNFDAVSQAVTHLANLGHRRIGIMNGGLMSVDGVERQLAFKKTLVSLGLPYREEFVGCANYSDEQASEEMTRILNSSSAPPTAMFCANDLMAIGVIHAIKRNGLRVPNDIAVVGFDDIDAARYFTPALTTLRSPLRDLGGEAVDLLIRRMQRPRSRPEQIPLKAKLIIRDSSGTTIASKSRSSSSRRGRTSGSSAVPASRGKRNMSKKRTASKKAR